MPRKSFHKADSSRAPVVGWSEGRSGRPAQPPPCPSLLVGVGGREQEGRESWGKDEEVGVHKEKPQRFRALGFHILSGYYMPKQW